MSQFQVRFDDDGDREIEWDDGWCAGKFHGRQEMSKSFTTLVRMPLFSLQGWAKEWTLGCVNPGSLWPRGGGEFTQPRDHSFAQSCSAGGRIHVVARRWDLIVIALQQLLFGEFEQSNLEVHSSTPKKLSASSLRRSFLPASQQRTAFR